jgi:hypothetical protein
MWPKTELLSGGDQQPTQINPQYTNDLDGKRKEKYV